MVPDSVRNYWTLLGSLTKATREQVADLTEEIVKTSRDNSVALVGLVRTEVDRALRRLGLASEDEVTSLTRRVRELEEQVRTIRETLPEDTGPEAKLPKKAAKKAPPKKAPAKKNGSQGRSE